ncbi:UvrD-helicase domain-containing protein [Paenibacillus sp. sptzw28]|uniref:RNA polymerase recycling motor HelD n=1 Tax=Paenibacillus sp. sptzw28 TaxID=715179 RepID=UPI001C6E5034|nr:RNA polymerase recycling motor HelD [Paenibacillus sp. sptzw28]QYR19652.1 UvrD-helicase domain-containing protein [Paenibacillus sp. sptzw28]
MSETNRDWAAEQRRVDTVVEQIDRRTRMLEQQTLDAKSEMVDIRKNFWDDVTVNFDDAVEMAETYASMKQQAELLFEREGAHRHAVQQLRTLRKLRESPYFGRIDFLEDGESKADRVYLGIASLRDSTDQDYLIYDWRAPISSLYYDYPPGPAEIQTPMGTVKGELKVKRQFVIRGGAIVSLFDTGVTIGDELLQEVLGKQSDAQMKSIVATIQREQNRIIRNERSRLLIVQGAAGSGKTSAALQRVAYLLYRYRGTLRADQIVLFSPNPMFNSYVSTVLPELGEENMQQTTFQEYLAHRIGKSFRLENPYVQLEYALTGQEEPGYETRMEGIRYKASADFVALMDRYLTHLGEEGLVFRDLSFRGETVKDAAAISEYFYSIDRSIALPNRLRLVASWLLERLRDREQAARAEAWVEEAIELLDNETYQKAFQSLKRNKQFSSESFDDHDRERELLSAYVVKESIKPLRTRVKKLGFVNLKGCFRQIFKDARFATMFGGSAAAGLPGLWPEICADTLARLDEGQLAYEDATPFLYLVERVRGFQTNTSVRHILIDEAQDYTAFQFAFLKRLFPRSKVTALGDVNQSIHAHTAAGISGITALAAQYEAEETETITLSRSYRSTRQIVEFTSLCISGGESIEPFNRDGAKPTLTVVAAADELHSRIARRIQALSSAGYKTIAVICKTASETLEAYEALKGVTAGIHLMEQDSSSFESGVVVIPSYLAKGVEFDAVIVYDASAAQYSRESERRLFYTVCTRAMHELHLYSIGSLTPFISGEALRCCTVEADMQEVKR